MDEVQRIADTVGRLEEEKKELFFENETRMHQQLVARYMLNVVQAILKRAATHDASKLEDPERAIFAEHTPKLRALACGSDEFKASLKETQVALDHHYRANHHHPEFNSIHARTSMGDEIQGMHLVDLIEMLADWMAVTQRRADGDIWRNIDKNQERFHVAKQLSQVFRNSIAIFENPGEHI